ncbi:MAG TPA: hypothetical protein VMX74_08385 [Pirellulales bacterium]|nr:hypothetical protein [Pirellulales bacterium]
MTIIVRSGANREESLANSQAAYDSKRDWVPPPSAPSPECAARRTESDDEN